MTLMLSKRVTRTSLALAAAIALAAPAAAGRAAPDGIRQAAPTGTWRGTSTCSDLVALPACHDEVVVYEFTAGARSGTVHWKAGKIVDGRREPMGELDLTYDPTSTCWTADVVSPQVHSVWCLVVEGTHMTGTGQRLPGKQIVRKVEVWKQ